MRASNACLVGMLLAAIGLAGCSRSAAPEVVEKPDPTRPDRATLTKQVNTFFGSTYQAEVVKFDLSPLNVFMGTTMKPNTWRVDTLCSFRSVEPLYTEVRLPEWSPFYNRPGAENEPSLQPLADLSKKLTARQEQFKRYLNRRGGAYGFVHPELQQEREQIEAAQKAELVFPPLAYQHVLKEATPVGTTFKGRLSYIAEPDLEGWKFSLIERDVKSVPPGTAKGGFHGTTVVLGSPEWAGYLKTIQAASAHLDDVLGKPLAPGLSMDGNQIAPVVLGSKTFVLEIANNNSAAALGLGDRPSIPADGGMIFVFHPSPMRMGPGGDFGTVPVKVPVDLVYVEADGSVASVHQITPETKGPVPSGKPIKWAIELNQGTADAVGLKPGDKLSIPKAAQD